MLAIGEVVVPKEFWLVVGRNEVRCAFGEQGLWVAERSLPNGLVRAWAFVVRGSGTARWAMAGGRFASLLTTFRSAGGRGRLVVEREAVLLEGQRFPIEVRQWRSESVPLDVEWGTVGSVPTGRWKVEGGRVVAAKDGYSAPIPVGAQWVGIWGDRLVFRWPQAEVILEAG